MSFQSIGFSTEKATFATADGVNPEDDFKVIIAHTDLRLEDVRHVAQILTAEIRNAPAAGMDIHGRPFAPYSPVYAKTKSSPRVNLRSDEKVKTYWRKRLIKQRMASVFEPGSALEHQQRIEQEFEFTRGEPLPTSVRAVSQLGHMLDAIRYKVVQQGSISKEIQIGVFDRHYAQRARVLNEGAIIKPHERYRDPILNTKEGPMSKAKYDWAMWNRQGGWRRGIKASEFITIPQREFLGVTVDALNRISALLLQGMIRRLGRV